MKTTYPKLTKKTAQTIIDLLGHGLTKGKGSPEPGKMCVEAAVCFALGLPHSDEPPCVSGVVRSFKISLNDSNWSSDQARSKGLKRLAIAQLGSENIDECLFAKELALATVRKIVPLALEAAAKLNPAHADKLNAAAKTCVDAKDLDAASYAASRAARAASAASYARAASAASSASAASAASSASCAASSASCAASSASVASRAARRAASYAASYAASCAASDRVLSIMAECAVEALIVCKSPGCKWLNLCK